MDAAGPDGASPWDLQLGVGWQPPDPPTDLPHPLRMMDYIIGGKDNYRADREAVDFAVELIPDLVLVARAAEAFVRRTIVWMAGPEQGVDQFLHLGTFIPTTHSLDGLVRQHRPGTPFVYVTDDQVSAAHARGVLAARARGAGEVHALLADVRDPAPILADPWLRQRLELDRPLGVLLFGMPDFTADDDRLVRALADLRSALAPGSLIAVTHVLAERDLGRIAAAMKSLGPNPYQYTPRPLARVAELFAGLEFVEPGLVRCTSWRPDGEGPGLDLEERCPVAGGVALVR
jgi:hypothetical protein